MKESFSLENLIETEDVGIEILHPGGLETTKELAGLCHIGKDSMVLDIASGTGESACYLVKNFGCKLSGVDVSSYMVERARKKSAENGLDIYFERGDAHNLSFGDNTFDAVISECTTCILDKEKAIIEMVRVAKPGGYVGIHDICWADGTPESHKSKLAEIEGERPETLEGWKKQFEDAGLKNVSTTDRSYLIREWTKEFKKNIGLKGQLKIFLKIIRNWGIGGLKTAFESEKIFESEYTGYGIIVGRKPWQ